MAKFIVTPGGIQLKLRWTLNGVECLNVFGGRANGAVVFDQTKADAFRDLAVGALTSAGLMARMGDSTLFVGVSIRNVALADQVEWVSNLATPVAGTGIGGALPRSAAVVATFKTSLAGQSHRGRAYMGGFAESENDTNAAITSAASTAVDAFWTAIHDNLPTLLIQQSILSPALPSRPSTIPGHEDLPAKQSENTPVETILVRNLGWGSQRRRTHRP